MHLINICIATPVSFQLARMPRPARGKCACSTHYIDFTKRFLITTLHTTLRMHCLLFFQMLWREETVSYRMRGTSITKVQVIVWRLPASACLPLRLVTVIATLSVVSSGTTVRLFESRDDRRGGGSLDMMIQAGIVGSRGDCDTYSKHGHMSSARKSEHAYCAGALWFTLKVSVLQMRSTERPGLTCACHSS